MNEEIKVHVVKYKDRANLMMRYEDPMTGKQIARSTGTTKKREAERIAAKWEAELREGRYQKPSLWTWQEFRDHHNEHLLAGMKVGTTIAYDSTLNVFERLANPQKLSDATTTRITAFATALREQGRSVATVARHLRHLKAVLRWAHRQGLLLKLPTIDMPKQSKGMRGRPITLEEFERMLVAVPKVAGELAADSWRFYLKGLWASGLRLEESCCVGMMHRVPLWWNWAGVGPCCGFLPKPKKATRIGCYRSRQSFRSCWRQSPKMNDKAECFDCWRRMASPCRLLAMQSVQGYLRLVGGLALW